MLDEGAFVVFSSLVVISSAAIVIETAEGTGVGVVVTEGDVSTLCFTVVSFGVGVVDICAVVRDVCPTLEEDEVVVLPEGEVSSGTLVEAHFRLVVVSVVRKKAHMSIDRVLRNLAS